ncbi:MAG: RDD family protein [Tolypothrix sp. Co-bin9]|nr:RDD family protein [Tolypothrix sp. Co-bin9]
MHLFNKIKFRTPESVELEFTLAGIGNRAWALLIDYLVLAVIMTVFVVAWVTVSVQLADLWTGIFGKQVSLWLVAIALIFGFAIYTGYFVFFETLWQGQTPGKRFAKIRVVRDDGRPVGLQQATLRALLRAIDEFFYLGSLFIIFSDREKRLGDLAAGTIVIQAQRPLAATTLTISEEAKPVYEHLLQVADLSLLLPDDFAVIREYLLRRSVMSTKARASLALELTKQVQDIIDLEKLPENVVPDVFLEAVYLAYKAIEFS